jgi:hypothetical protein
MCDKEKEQAKLAKWSKRANRWYRAFLWLWLVGGILTILDLNASYLQADQQVMRLLGTGLLNVGLFLLVSAAAICICYSIAHPYMGGGEL